MLCAVCALEVRILSSFIVCVHRVCAAALIVFPTLFSLSSFVFGLARVLCCHGCLCPLVFPGLAFCFGLCAEWCVLSCGSDSVLLSCVCARSVPLYSSFCARGFLYPPFFSVLRFVLAAVSREVSSLVVLLLSSCTMCAPVLCPCMDRSRPIVSSIILFLFFFPDVRHCVSCHGCVCACVRHCVSCHG